jgi:glycogen phosphorylase
MKFIMNGSIIIGTMDGANVEIAEEIGAHNMFIFGALVPEVDQFRKQLYEGRRDYIGSRLKKVFDTIRNGTFGDVSVIHGMLYGMENGGDHYCTCLDFYPYITAQEKVDETYRDQRKWSKMAIEGIAYSGKFSSDRTI